MSIRDVFDVAPETDLNLDKTTAILVFLVPGLTLFGVFSVLPMVYSVIGSFFAWDTFDIQHFVGLENWARTLQDPLIIHFDNMRRFRFPMGALPQNLLWMVIHVPVSTLLGLGLALLFFDLKGQRIFRSMIFLGFTTPTIVIGLVLLFIYDPQAGIFNELLRVVGQDHLVRDWVRQQQVAIFALIAGGIWIQTGFSMLLYASALSTIDPALLESARVDGANAWRRFRDIIWPLVMPVTAVVVIMGMIWVLRIFAIVYAAGGAAGGPQHAFSVLGIEVYRAAFHDPIDYGQAMVIALIQLLICVPLAWYIADME